MIFNPLFVIYGLIQFLVPIFLSYKLRLMFLFGMATKLGILVII